jgi:hypothetical protein
MSQQHEANNMLVRALIDGQPDRFQELLTQGVEIEGEQYRAQFTALNNENINQYLSPRDFNVGVPQDNAGARNIIRNIHNGQYGPPEGINLPAMAANFLDPELMQRLIDEPARWNFNQSIGVREAKPISLSISADDGSVINQSYAIAMQLLQNSEAIALDISNTRTGISNLYGQGTKGNRVMEYLTLIPRLSAVDLGECASFIPAGINLATSSTDPTNQKQQAQAFTALTARIIDDISSLPPQERNRIIDRMVQFFEGHQITNDEGIICLEKITGRIRARLGDTTDPTTRDAETIDLVQRVSQINSRDRANSGDTVDSAISSTPPPPSRQSSSFFGNLLKKAKQAISFSSIEAQEQSDTKSSSPPPSATIKTPPNTPKWEDKVRPQTPPSPQNRSY